MVKKRPPKDNALKTIPKSRVRWRATFRIVPDRYPPIASFERIASSQDRALLEDFEELTDPLARQEIGEISLVPPSRRVYGPGASIVMAPFAHASKERPTRFSDGSYGVYYAGHNFVTALYEVRFHMGRFYAATDDEPHDETFRTYKGWIDKTLHDLRVSSWSAFLDPDPAKYGAPQRLGSQLRGAGSYGIVYPSVRIKGGKCIAAFWPDVVPIPVESGHVSLRWDGNEIGSWFNYETGMWSLLM